MNASWTDNDIASSVAVVFAKPPAPGEVKTRLTNQIDEQLAADLYRAFLEDTAERLASFQQTCESSLTTLLAYTGRPDAPAFECFWQRGFLGIEQQGADLGARMHGVSQRCFDSGADRVVIVGSDSPTLLNRHLASAFDALTNRDVVYGPSFDGGYYLVGVDQPRPTLFDGIDWSTRSVLRQSLTRGRRADLLCELLEFWYDIDTFDDLRHLHFHLLEYLAREDHTVAPRTAKLLETLEREGLFDLDAS